MVHVFSSAHKNSCLRLFKVVWEPTKDIKPSAKLLTKYSQNVGEAKRWWLRQTKDFLCTKGITPSKGFVAEVHKKGALPAKDKKGDYCTRISAADKARQVSCAWKKIQNDVVLIEKKTLLLFFESFESHGVDGGCLFLLFVSNFSSGNHIKYTK